MERFAINTPSQTNAKQIVLFGKLRISVLTTRMIRVEKGIFRDEPTQKVWYRDFCRPEFSVDKRNEKLFVKTTDVTFAISPAGKVKVIFADGREVSNFKKGNLLGTARTLDNAYGAIPLKEGVISKRGVAVLDDSDGLSLKDGEIKPLQKGVYDKYYFAYGNDYRGALKDFYALCGQTPLIPKYALGNWWSRYKAYTQQEYVDLMQEFITRKIPVTVATIDMDWHWVKVVQKFGEEAKSKGGSNWQDKIFSMIMQGWTGYSWNTDLFPDYKQMFAWLKENGFHITLNVHPSQGVRFFEDQYQAMCDRLGLDASKKEQIPFDLSNYEFIAAYFDLLHRPYEEDGVDFWWIDWQQGKTCNVKGLDPLWALNHYHYLESARTGHRSLILSRYAEAGSHRYPLGFSGDAFISWPALKFQPYFTANAANVGYTWWSHDIGGHQRGRKDDELYVRWVQFGVFSPINRLHSSINEFSGKEPWKCSKQAERVAVDFLRLRQKLIPFLYSAAYRTHTLGIAVCEPLYYKYKEDENAYKFPNEYVFGNSLLVAPITSKINKTTLTAGVKVWLPEKARYTDVFTGAIYYGGQVVKMFRPLESFPVLAKEGSIIPTYKNVETNDLSLAQPLEIWVYRGTGSFTFYEDNGIDYAYEKGEYSVSKLTINETANGYSFTYKENEDGELELPEREITVLFKDIVKAKILLNGKPVESEREDIVAVRIHGKSEIILSECVCKKNPPKKELLINLCSQYQTATTNKLFKYLRYVKGTGKLHCVRKAEKEPILEIEKMYFEEE